MQLVIKTYDALCSTKIFTINGKAADSSDFGHSEDVSPETAEDYDYCCGDRQFLPQESTPEVLARYNINEAEYQQICNELQNKLSWGSCGWCS